LELLILAKSDKKCNNGTKGFCIAGTTEDGKWIRLVSDECGDAIADAYCRKIKVGNSLLIDDHKIIKCPLDFQPENYLVCDFNGISISSKSVQPPKTSDDQYIFLNNRHFLYTNEMVRISKSLLLADVQNFRIYRDERGKHKASFSYNNFIYDKMSITDPNYYREYCAVNTCIVVSLPPEPWEGKFYFKFIAAVNPI